MSPTWLTHLCPSGLRAPWPFPSPSAEDKPRVGASWSCQPLSCAPCGWLLLIMVRARRPLPMPASQGPALSGLPLPPALAHFYCVSGPSTVWPAPAPSACLFLLRLRAQHCPACPCSQRLPVSTASRGPALSGLPLPPALACFYCVSGPSTARPAPAPSACPFLLLQDMLLLAWCAQGRVRLPVIPSLGTVGVHVCVHAHMPCVC